MSNPPTTCPKCGKDCKYASYLRRHLARKTPCAPILEDADLPPEVHAQRAEDPDLAKKQCRFCNRIFSSYTSMRRHVRISCRIAPNAKNGDTGMELLYEHTLRKQQKRIEILEAQNAEMISMMRQLTTAGGSSPQLQQAGEVTAQGDQGTIAVGDHNTVAVDNSKNKMQVIINVFGHEGLGHVTRAEIKGILDEALRVHGLSVAAAPAAAMAATLRTAMLIYSDPDHPENLTCYLPNKKTEDTLVHGERGWEVRPTRLVLPPMAAKSVDSLFAKQPYENADQYLHLLRELRDNASRYTSGAELRPILVRNKDLLARALETLPVASQA